MKKKQGGLLKDGSLAMVFLVVAKVLGHVLKGRNLEVAMQSNEIPVGIRPAVIDFSYNTLRRYARGEAVLELLVDKKIKVPEIQALLLAALWRIEVKPDDRHTTVNQAVESASMLANGKFQKLVNAVLRNYLRREGELKDFANLNIEALWQHPAWWIEMLKAAYHEDWSAILDAGNSHPPMSLRVNRRLMTIAGYQESLNDKGIGVCSGGGSGMRLANPVPVDLLPGFREGVVSVQDLGAQRTAEFLDLQTGQRVLDACAAPGGKTSHILECADVEMLALEAEPKRAQRIHENLDRLHLYAQVKVVDCRQVAKWWDGRFFDRILADVPCSASGVVRRHPDAKYLRRPEDVYSFAATQREIIDALWPVLAPGGKMLYCTCSVFPEENGRQIAAFLERHPDAERMMIAGQDELQLLPNADHDGFYFALLRKRAS